MWLTRKRIVNAAPVLIAIAAIAGCAGARDLTHLSSRPHPPAQAVELGAQMLHLSDGRDGMLYVPTRYRPDKAMPLLVMLHGAGGDAKRMSWLFSVAEDAGVIMLMPESRRRTWDLTLSRFGEDVDFLDRALEFTFDLCLVDSGRIALGGFSDGASYALSLGLCNGGLFTHVIALSPGFMVVRRREGNVRIYLAHGTIDQILPIDSTSRVIASELRRWGYDVFFREFVGRHTIPEAVAREALRWFVR